MRFSRNILLLAVAATSVPGALAESDPNDPVFNTPTKNTHQPSSWLRDAVRSLLPNWFSTSSEKGNHDESFVRQLRFQKEVQTKYADQVVLRFNISTPEDELAVAEATHRLFLDVWNFSQDRVDVRVPLRDIRTVLQLLPEVIRNSYTVLISETELGSLIHNTYPPSYRNLHGLSDEHREIYIEQSFRDIEASILDENSIFFDEFQPLPVITQWLKLLEVMFPSIAQTITVGTSAEGREIPGIRLGVRSSGATRPRKTIVILGGLHAREWIATSTVNYVAWSLISLFGEEHLITKLLEKFDVVLLPVVNPDGYEYTWDADRLWRKNRQSTPVRFCTGLDLDHSFGYEWGESTSGQQKLNQPPRNDPCSESYAGEEPFEAVEARQLAEWVHNITSNGDAKMIGVIDLHSYSQEVLYPYSYTCDIDPPNLENLEELAAGLAKAIRLSSGEIYSVMSACEGTVGLSTTPDGTRSRLEAGGGSALDWFHKEAGSHYTYQIKLRDTGIYGFLVPKEMIKPTGEEILHAVKYFADFLLGNNGIESVSSLKDQEGLETETHPTRNQELRKRRR